MSVEELQEVMEEIKKIYVSKPVKRYMVDLVNRTRQSSDVYLGASPRGSLALFRTGQAVAALAGRDFVLPDDIKSLAVPVLAHRVIVGPAARLRELSAEKIVEEILENLPVPAEISRLHRHMKLSHASALVSRAGDFSSLAGWILTGLVIYARLAYLGIFLMAGAAIWTVLSINGIHLRRNTRTLRASMGDVFEEHYEIKKETWPGCAWLEVLNQSTLPNAAGSRLLTRIDAHQLRYYSARTLLTRRGAYLLGPTTLTSGDPFGLFTRHKMVTARDTLIILPMTFPIPTFPPPPGLLPGGKAIRQRTFDVTPHAAEVREYVPGDPMKRIHWPSTAHRGQFMVKEFEQDPQADIWLFLDAYRPVHLSIPEPEVSYQDDKMWLRRPKVSLPKDTFEYAVSVAASLASFFLMDQAAVGLACAAGKFTVVSCRTWRTPNQ